MNEAEWMGCTHPQPMIDFLKDTASVRKMRLLGCACSRRVLTILNNPQAEKTIDIAERVADGDADAKSLWEELGLLQDMVKGQRPATATYQGTMGIALAIGSFVLATGKPDYVLFRLGLNSLAGAAAWQIAPNAEVEEDDWSGPHDPVWRRVESEERQWQAEMVRDIFGNPSRPVVFDPTWLTPTVVKLAQSVYVMKAFDRLPVLADALREVRCDCAQIVNHCRVPRLHAKGCWVVDKVLGKG